MTAPLIPARFEATGTDIAVSITRVVMHHRIGLRLGFDGRLDADRLERAVGLSLDAEPILGCAFRTGPFRAWWERMPDLDATRPFSVVENGDPERDYVAFHAEPIADAGPQAAVRLFRSAERDVLGVKVSHVLADGQAAKQYAYLLADIYSRLGADPDYRPQPNLRARPTAKDVWAQLDAQQRRDAKTARSWAMPNWRVPAKGAGGGGMTSRLLALDPARFTALKAYGNARRATVNDMLLAAFFRGCVASFDPATGKPLSLMCTADLRRYLPDAATLPIANISISGSLDIERVDGEPFDETLRRVKERMAVWAKASYGAGPALNADKMTALGYAATKLLLTAAIKGSGSSGDTYPWFTNIGIIDEGRLTFDGVAPVSGSVSGPANFGACIVPTISTYRDTLTICMSFCAEDIDAGVIEGVLRATDEQLAALAWPRSSNS
jgi:NRPS condensation-like uncharacterized protein